jgi:2-polyprenyl-3-methyl-5-hydroxy-6-metoxy-1,4-benzoquinol methylase
MRKMESVQSRNFFSGYAANFDAIYANHTTPFNFAVNRLLRRSMRQRFELTISGCNPIGGRSVLDIGCGPGHYAVELARRGAASVTGLDFADGMLELARVRATRAGVEELCCFERGDFLTWARPHKFDYVIAMGFMDYIADPIPVIFKILSLTVCSAFFSFPLDGGLLAWQRKLRYRKRCPLYMYTAEQVARLFAQTGYSVNSRRISRDLFVICKVK